MRHKSNLTVYNITPIIPPRGIDPKTGAANAIMKNKVITAVNCDKYVNPPARWLTMLKFKLPPPPTPPKRHEINCAKPLPTIIRFVWPFVPLRSSK